MNRFKITQSGIEKAKRFLKGLDKTGPRWAEKYKDKLTIKGKKLLYQDKIVVAVEDLDELLRKEIFSKNSTVPPSRDAAFYKLNKKYIGCPRRKIMEWLRKQKPLGATRPSVPQPKQKNGIKQKSYVFETDLIFLRKNDLEKANPIFKRKDINFETYIVSTVEKVTGLYRCDHTDTKDSKVVTPIVIKQMKDMAKQLNVNLNKCGYRSDRGGEFDMVKMRAVCDPKNTKNVNSGGSIEGRNRLVQSNFFRIIRSRKSFEIDDALKQSQILMNETYNRIQKKTPNEAADEKQDENVKKFNKKRKTYVAGDKRKLEVGDYVRIIKKGKEKIGLEYKSYKGILYTDEVYEITKKTKSVPTKYRANKKWYTIDKLLKSALRDEKTEEMIVQRDIVENLV